jgi:hypothetical protein
MASQTSGVFRNTLEQPDSEPEQRSFVCLALEAACKKAASFLSAFPMFVPSLSWQKDHFYIQMASQKDRPRFLTFVTATLRRFGACEKRHF